MRVRRHVDDVRIPFITAYEVDAVSVAALVVDSLSLSAPNRLGLIAHGMQMGDRDTCVSNLRDLQSVTSNCVLNVHCKCEHFL